jgi:hypothetical protein
MSYRMQVLIGVVLVAFAAVHVAAATMLESGRSQPTSDAMSWQRD